MWCQQDLVIVYMIQAGYDGKRLKFSDR